MKRYTNTDLATLIIGVDQKLTKQIHGLSGDQRETKAELTQSIEELRGEFTVSNQELRNDFKQDLLCSNEALRGEIKTAIQEFRVDVKQDIEVSKDEIIAVIRDVVQIVSDKIVNLDTRTTRLERAVFTRTS